jgi:hypothetical protein
MWASAFMNMKEYSMSCHGIFLIYSFSAWKILCDVAKYSMTWHGIFFMSHA